MKAPSLSIRRGFSLVELLGVITILVIIIALSATAFRGTPGSSMTAAGNLVVDMIHEARQIAAAKNTKTMLVVTSGAANSSNQELLAGRRLAVFSYSPETTANGGWSQVGAWQTLPTPIRVDLNRAVSAPGVSLFTDPPAALSIKFGNTPASVKAAVFLPDGRLLTNDDKPHLAFVNEEIPNSRDEYRIILNPATGIPVVRRP